jgi:divalent metal cation (Fe/Co/Zn/Cd) transporter
LVGVTSFPDMTQVTLERPALVRRGLFLNYLTIAYNVVEAVVSIVAGLVAGSVALLGFGIDSAIEVTASGAAQWRLRVDHHEGRRAHAERRTRRIIGVCFLVLALYIGVDAASALWQRDAPDRSLLGLVILAVSLIVMPWLARQKRTVARALASPALQAEARQTSLCAYLSAIALIGVGLNAALGWWWADPVAALAMTSIILKEGIDGLRSQNECDDCA